MHIGTLFHSYITVIVEINFLLMLQMTVDSISGNKMIFVLLFELSRVMCLSNQAVTPRQIFVSPKMLQSPVTVAARSKA